jgi:hypothetical protein
MSPSVQPDGSAVIVKVELEAGLPPTVTENDPVDEPLGTVTEMERSLQVTTVALAAPRETVLVPCGVPNPVPVMVTSVPTGPEVGEMPVIVGACARAWPQQTNNTKNAAMKFGFQFRDTMCNPLKSATAIKPTATLERSTEPDGNN